MPDCDEAGHPALDEEEGMHPADAAVPVGVTENPVVETEDKTQTSKKGRPGGGLAAPQSCPRSQKP